MICYTHMKLSKYFRKKTDKDCKTFHCRNDVILRKIRLTRRYSLYLYYNFSSDSGLKGLSE